MPWWQWVSGIRSIFHLTRPWQNPRLDRQLFIKVSPRQVQTDEDWKKEHTLPPVGLQLGKPTIHTTYISARKRHWVIIDAKLSFEHHIAAKINKANSVLGLINHTFEYKDSKTMVLLYKSLVRPHLEYANQIWAPHLMKHVIALENVQRRATRMIPGLKNLDYTQRLIKLQLPTLSFRRLKAHSQFPKRTFHHQ